MEQGGIWLQTQLRLLCTAHHLPTVQHVDKIGLLDHCDDDVIFKTPCHHNICRRPNPTHRKWSHHSGRQGEASWVSYFTARLHNSQCTVPGPTVEGSQPGSRAQSSARLQSCLVLKARLIRAAHLGHCLTERFHNVVPYFSDILVVKYRKTSWALPDGQSTTYAKRV